MAFFLATQRQAKSSHSLLHFACVRLSQSSGSLRFLVERETLLLSSMHHFATPKLKVGHFSERRCGELCLAFRVLQTLCALPKLGIAGLARFE